MARTPDKQDRELAAISAILGALDGLDGESIQRVLDYVFGRLSITASRMTKPLTTVAGATPPVATEHTRTRRISIRDLKEEKRPESSNQMAALIAFYLSEVAEEEAERKDEVTAADLEKYFKQAGFKLPKALPQTLPNAAAAGYFDATGSGKYRLNAVGYNLVVHGLPRDHSDPIKRRVRKSRKKSKRATR